MQNERNRRLNQQHGLSAKITVVDGTFESLPFADQSYDVVWSEDALLHSGDKSRVFAEVARVLAPGGLFIFTDPMQADDCPAETLKPILDRIHLESLGSFGVYRQLAEEVGLVESGITDLSAHLPRHYRRVQDELSQRRKSLQAHVSPQYIDRMIHGLGHWIRGGEQARLTWGILRFRRPTSESRYFRKTGAGLSAPNVCSPDGRGTG